MTKRAIAACAAAMAMTIAPSAQASCWSQPATHAARMRQLDVLLMVGSLRCRAGGDDYRTDYDHFLIRHRASLGAANRVMLGEFGKSLGARGAMNALDRMSVTIANGYGSGGGYGCDQLHAMARDLSHASTADLDKAADSVIAETVVTPACTRSYASRR